MSKSYKFDKNEKIEKYLEKIGAKKERAARREKREAKVFA